MDKKRDKRDKSGSVVEIASRDCAIAAKIVEPFHPACKVLVVIDDGVSRGVPEGNFTVSICWTDSRPYSSKPNGAFVTLML